MTAWWNSLDTFDRQMTVGGAISLVMLLIVIGLAVSNFRAGRVDPRPVVQEQEVCLHSRSQLVPILGSTQYGVVCFGCGFVSYPDPLPEPGTFTPEERSEEYRGGSDEMVGRY